MPTTVSVASRVHVGRLVLAVGLFAASVAAAQRPASPAAALRIVVVAGEDAVNIIQQKTAVAPIVEVRDRNDQPVAGAVVNFAIRSGRATFGGARTLSVTTDAVGRAVASGLTPTGSGALQISASAAFQGQTAAVTIAQTNVLTAAQAAVISGGGAAGGAGGAGSGAGTAAGAGGASAGGGGINGLTLGLLGAGAGAGTLVAVKAAGGNSSSSPTSSSPPPTQPPPTQPPPTQPPTPPQPSNMLYDIVMTPAVTTIQQCPQAPPNNGPGPVGTSVNFVSDGSFTGDLFANVPNFRLVTMSGRWTPTDLTGAIVCIGGGGPTGSLSGTGSQTRYTGSWNFGGLGGTFVLTPK